MEKLHVIFKVKTIISFTNHKKVFEVNIDKHKAQ